MVPEGFVLDWEAYDTRTGKAVSMRRYPSEERMLEVIEMWRARDRAGGRPDCSHLMPYLAARRIEKDGGKDEDGDND